MKLDLRSFGLALCIIIAFVAFSQLLISTIYPNPQYPGCYKTTPVPEVKNITEADIKQPQECDATYQSQMNSVREKRFITGLVIALLTVIIAMFLELSIPTKYGLFASGALTVLISSFQAPEGTYVGVGLAFLVLLAIIYFIEKEED